MLGLFEYFFMPPGPVGQAFGRWSGVLFGVYVGILLTMGMAFLLGRTMAAGHGFKLQTIRRFYQWGALLQVVGILLLALRFLNWPLLSMRILLYAQLLAEVGAALYLWRWLQLMYPLLLEVYEWEEKKRAFLPKAAGGAVEPRVRKAPVRRKR